MSYDSKTPRRGGIDTPSRISTQFSTNSTRPTSTLLSPSALANARLRDQLSAVSISCYILFLVYNVIYFASLF